MRKFGAALLAVLLLLVPAAPAAAHHGVHGHVFIEPLVAALLLPFAVAATITAGVAALVTAPFAYPYPPYAPAPVYTAPPVYAAPPSPPAPSYWYYCPSARGYYPYVRSCLDGWLKVVPR